LAHRHPDTDHPSSFSSVALRFAMALSPLDGPTAVIDEDIRYVDWPAIFGAVIISSASTLLLGAIGVALGLASVSPWSFNNPSPTAMTVASAAWFALSALYAGAVGGYIVGRLRKPALDTTADERSNRDGLNALVTWGLGLLLTAALTTSILSSAAGTAVTAAGQAAGPALSETIKASSNKAGDFVGYYVDRALRAPANAANPGAPATTPNDSKTEVARILTHGLASGSISDADRGDLERIVARQAGISDADAKARVNQMMTEANDAYNKAADAVKEAADKARKITASITTWFVIVSLLAAILAWYAGVIGGRHRDQKLIV
jgi:hypothetical protein